MNELSINVALNFGWRSSISQNLHLPVIHLRVKSKACNSINTAEKIAYQPVGNSPQIYLNRCWCHETILFQVCTFRWQDVPTVFPLPAVVGRGSFPVLRSLANLWGFLWLETSGCKCLHHFPQCFHQFPQSNELVSVEILYEGQKGQWKLTLSYPCRQRVIDHSRQPFTRCIWKKMGQDNPGILTL